MIRSRGERRSAFANFKIDKVEGRQKNASRGTTGAAFDRDEILSPLLYASKLSIEEEIGSQKLNFHLSTAPLPEYMYDLDIETEIAEHEKCSKKEGFFSSKKVSGKQKK